MPKIQSPPGMRDFYPDDMRQQNWLFDAWRDVSRSFGFVEYEGPIFEYLDLYKLKSGDGIVSELFHFQDRGEREFAIRPEMTPTLARMIAARANALPRPIKWFSIPRMCRAEKPQKGRLREFFQWNADILGLDEMIADAEVIAVVVAFLRRIGLSPSEAVVKVSSRPLAARLLESIGIAPERQGGAFDLIDRMTKTPAAEFDKKWNDEFGGSAPAARLRSVFRQSSLADAEAALGGIDGPAREAFADLWNFLKAFDVADFCRFDPGVVRGIAYYTGTVFEVHAADRSHRALAGGGRYDNLTGLLDGPNVPGVGFGMGDAPIQSLLADLGRTPKLDEALDAFLIDADARFFPQLMAVANRLRANGLRADFSYKRQALGKQFKQASSRAARVAVIIGEEFEQRGELIVKNLATGQQQAVAIEELATELSRL
ncbi:MAG: histidine--tRNA ligase [Phycisphaerales bacterium]|nr:histidine--tRNA ligase [Phycisphaerales bacterium]